VGPSQRHAGIYAPKGSGRNQLNVRGVFTIGADSPLRAEFQNQDLAKKHFKNILEKQGIKV
jgi:hypothetical protein